MAKSRQAVVNLVESWDGKKESNGSHKSIIDLYNDFFEKICAGKFPRGIRMRYDWAWCACTWSALAAALRYESIMPIAAEDALFAMLDGFAPVELRRVLFRGKNLGTALTAVQKAAIKDGSFKGMFLGDYWSIGSRIWRIVDMDYWYNCGDTAFTSHHLVIMPDEALYNAQMNTTNVTTGGYVGSAMYKSNLANAKTIVNAAFQGSVLTHREYLCNAVANGRPSGGAWFDSSIELPNEPMMYGHPHFSPTSDGSTVPSIYTISKTQLALFMVCPRFIVNRSYNQWLRDVVSSAAFALVGNFGTANSNYASASLGVRPVFPVG